MDNLIEKTHNYSQNYNQCLKGETNSCSHLNEDVKRKNEHQIVDSPQQKQPNFEDFEILLENLKKLETENSVLKTELDSVKAREQQFELKINTLEKELNEFKKINTIQENCIENCESEILRLNECLKVTELMLNETLEVSEKIISDLKSKLDSISESPISPNTTELTGFEVKSQPIKHQKSKPSFYLELNRNPSQNSNDLNKKTKYKLKTLNHQMNDDLRYLVIQIIRQLSQTVDSLEQLPDLLTTKLNKTFGKFWFCVLGENIENSVLDSSNKCFLKCELTGKYQVIVIKYFDEFSPNNSIESSQGNSTDIGGEQFIRVVKKSHNIETQIEKFIVNIALKAQSRNFEDYHRLSSYIRDAICNKYSSQWFVSVGQTQHYCTSWALSRSRKFMLFEIGDIKFTIGEVAGWLW